MSHSARCYTDGWDRGDQIHLPAQAGWYYWHAEQPTKPLRCLHVEPGFRVRVCTGWRGEREKSVWFEAGYYPDLSYYRNQHIGDDDFALEIETVDHKPEQLTWLYDATPWFGEVANQVYGAWWAVPPGKSTAQGHFLDDRTDWVRIPKFHHATLYERHDYSGETVPLGPGLHDLREIGFQNKLGSLEVLQDDMELVDVQSDLTQAKKEVENTILDEMTIHNTGQGDSTTHKVLTRTVEISVEENWSMEAGIALTTSVEASAGAEGVASVKVSESVEISVEAGYGQSTARAETVERSVEAELELAPGQEGRIKVLVQVETAEVPVVRTWRSKKTGETLKEQGTVKAESASEAWVDYL